MTDTDQPHEETLSALLRRERAAQGLSTRQLGALVNVMPSTISKWEQGMAVPRAQYLPALAKALELSGRRLYELAGIDMPHDALSLPAMLRAEYDLPPEAIAEVERTIARVAREYGATKFTESTNETSHERRKP